MQDRASSRGLRPLDEYTSTTMLFILATTSHLHGQVRLVIFICFLHLSAHSTFITHPLGNMPNMLAYLLCEVCLALGLRTMRRSEWLCDLRKVGQIVLCL